MNYITITTPDNIDVKYRLAGAGSRMAAAIIDAFLQLAVLIMVLLFTLIVFFQNDAANIGSSSIQSFALGFILVSCLAFYLGYFIISETLMNGQSLGKKIFRLRVIRENGRPIGFLQSLLRNIFRLFIDMTGIGVISIMFSKKSKRIGDMVASTIVVAESPEQISLEDLSLEVDLNSSITVQSDNLQLTDLELRLIQDYFIREGYFTDKGDAALNSIINYLSNKFSVPTEKLNRDIILKLIDFNRKQV